MPLPNESKSSFIYSHLLLLEEECLRNEAELSFVHKFFFKIEKDNRKYYVKLNLYDEEYYCYSKNRPLQIFRSYEDFLAWVKKIII